MRGDFFYVDMQRLDWGLSRAHEPAKHIVNCFRLSLSRSCSFFLFCLGRSILSLHLFVSRSGEHRSLQRSLFLHHHLFKSHQPERSFIHTVSHDERLVCCPCSCESICLRLIFFTNIHSSITQYTAISTGDRETVSGKKEKRSESNKERTHAGMLIGFMTSKKVCTEREKEQQRARSLSAKKWITLRLDC